MAANEFYIGSARAGQPKLQVKQTPANAFIIHKVQADSDNRQTAVALFFIFVLSSTTCAADQTPNPTVPTPDRLAAIQQAHKEAETGYAKASEGLPDTPKGSERGEDLWKEFDKKQSDLFMAAVELARIDPTSDTAFAALEWVLTIPRAYYLPAGVPAMELATAHHATNPKVGKIIAWLGYYTPPEGEASRSAALTLIRAVADKNPDRIARGQAVMALAWQAKQQFAEKGDNNSPEVETLAAKAEQGFEAVLRDYADCPRLMKDSDPRTLGQEAQQELYELRYLRVGKLAPEVEGEDVDGRRFKLSDYRGKVVMIDFWGDW